MATIIVGEKVRNKKGEVGTILSYDDTCIRIDFSDRVVQMLCNAFEQGFLKYENQDLQGDIDQSVTQARMEKEEAEAAVRHAKEKAQSDRRLIQAQSSRTHFKVAILAASIRMDDAPLSLNGVRRRDVDLVQGVFADCDKDTADLYSRFKPKMTYPWNTSKAKGKYCVGFLSKYRDTYVFRVFSRTDLYKKTSADGVTVKDSDTTEILRVMRINGKLYYFSKNISCGGGYISNSKSHGTWHVSDLNSSVNLNEVIQNCDVGYLNNYVATINVDLLCYARLLFAAMVNNKVEILFKNHRFTSIHRIPDIVAFVENYTSKQLDFAAKNDVLHTLPIIKRYGVMDLEVLRSMEIIFRKRANGHSIYGTLADTFQRLGFDHSDLVKRLLAFVKKVGYFHPTIYADYVVLLSQCPGVTARDFFDSDYVERHNVMTMERRNRYDEAAYDPVYRREAEKLAWIDREENGYFILVPKTITEFRYEGNIQHNCVYTNQYYHEVIDHQSIIVFLRRDKNVPYVTIEFDYETFEVYQAYGKFNSNIDRELYDYIVDLGKRLRSEFMSNC